jgi:hypothetical protein
MRISELYFVAYSSSAVDAVLSLYVATHPTASSGRKVAGTNKLVIMWVRNWPTPVVTAPGRCGSPARYINALIQQSPLQPLAQYIPRLIESQTWDQPQASWLSR